MFHVVLSVYALTVIFLAQNEFRGRVVLSGTASGDGSLLLIRYTGKGVWTARCPRLLPNHNPTLDPNLTMTHTTHNTESIREV